MLSRQEEVNLFYLTDKDQKLPIHLEKLFIASCAGDEAATYLIIDEFLPSIKYIAYNVQHQHKVTDRELKSRIFNSGIKTLKDLAKLHYKEGFCKFIIMAIRQNMISTVLAFEN